MAPLNLLALALCLALVGRHAQCAVPSVTPAPAHTPKPKPPETLNITSVTHTQLTTGPAKTPEPNPSETLNVVTVANPELTTGPAQTPKPDSSVTLNVTMFANGTTLDLVCPTDNATQIESTGWYTCSDHHVQGLYRIQNDGSWRAYHGLSEIAPLGTYNLTDNATLSITQDCSHERRYMCRRRAKVGYQNQCWTFTVRNCSVYMSSDANQHACDCQMPRSSVGTLSSAVSHFAAGVLGVFVLVY